ncbi:hypothetical protein EVA_12475 [gut metagenome]|uniref:Uncharacterized protein n=1 Tax=gut metagenome TaxID=749906 RepID=J9GIQ2_9ZZZZ
MRKRDAGITIQYRIRPDGRPAGLRSGWRRRKPDRWRKRGF